MEKKLNNMARFGIMYGTSLQRLAYMLRGQPVDKLQSELLEIEERMRALRLSVRMREYEKSKVSTGYTGHGENTGGLQRHSIGEDFPYTVVGTQENGHSPVQWYAMDTRTGNRGHTRRTYMDAQRDIVNVRIRNMMHG